MCLRLPDTIYCSVLCNNDVEFSTTPLNPYQCGSQTGFKWRDFTTIPQPELPRCTGDHDTVSKFMRLWPTSVYMNAKYNLTMLVSYKFASEYSCANCNIFTWCVR